VGSVENRLEKEDLTWLGLLHGLVEQPGMLEGGSAAARGSVVATGRRRERQRGCRCCCGEVVEAGGAPVVFAPVVGSGGWPCC